MFRLYMTAGTTALHMNT